jgi:hypothetical protein
MKTCYFCGNPATTKEHIPPISLFPIKFTNIDYRKNLITVPSCEEHNSKKSNDDEYFSFVLKTSYNSNNIPEKLMKDKLIRSIYRNPNQFNKIFKNAEFSLTKINGLYHNIVKYEIDIDRINNVLKHISMGLYYYEYKTICKYNFIGSNFLSEGVESEKIKEILKISELIPYKGENKKIFKYKIIITDELYFLILLIYEGNIIITKSNK